MTSGKDKTIEEIENIVNFYGYNLIRTYMSKENNNTYKRRIVVSNIDGYKANIIFYKFTDRKGSFRFFDKSNPYTLENISLWLKINNKNFKLCEDNIYDGSTKKLNFYCFKCTETFYAEWGSILFGQNCSICAGMQVGKYNNLAYINPILVSEWIICEDDNHITPDQVPEFSTKKVLWECLTCKHRWSSKISDRSSGYGCPKCNESKGEKEITRILDKYKVKFIPQYKFNDCYGINKIKRKLPFDFYLYDFGIIEFHGRQHYICVNYFGGDKGFEELKIRDRIKEEYCIKNNIPFLIISYLDFNNIESILVNYLDL